MVNIYKPYFCSYKYIENKIKKELQHITPADIWCILTAFANSGSNNLVEWSTKSNMLQAIEAGDMSILYDIKKLLKEASEEVIKITPENAIDRQTSPISPEYRGAISYMLKNMLDSPWAVDDIYSKQIMFRKEQISYQLLQCWKQQQKTPDIPLIITLDTELQVKGYTEKEWEYIKDNLELDSCVPIRMAIFSPYTPLWNVDDYMYNVNKVLKRVLRRLHNLYTSKLSETR